MILVNEILGSSIATIALLLRRRRCYHRKKINGATAGDGACPTCFFVSVAMTVKKHDETVVVQLVPSLELLQRTSLLQPTIEIWLGGEITMVSSSWDDY